MGLQQMQTPQEWEKIFQSIEHPILILDPEFNILDANQAAIEAIGASIERIRGKKCFNIFYHAEQNSKGCPLNQILNSGHSETGEMKFDIPNGVFLVSCTPIFDDSGNLQRVIHVMTNITPIKSVEEALRISNERAQHLAQENQVIAEIGKIISSTINIEEIYERFSDEVRKIIPFDRIVINFIDIEKKTVINVYIAGEGIPGRKVGAIYPLEGSGNAEIVRTKSTFLLQTEDINEIKEHFPMLLSTFQAGFRSIMNVPLFSRGEIIGGLLLRSLKLYAYSKEHLRLAERVGTQIAGTIANAQLYLQRKQTEEILKESHERLVTVLDSMDADIYVADLMTYKILFINQHMRDSFGGNLIGQICWKVFRGESKPCDQCKNVKLVDATGNSTETTGVIIWEEKDPVTQKWYTNYCRVIKWVDGRLVRLQIVIDITERKKSEEEREKLIQELQEALSNIKRLSGLIPICSSCKKIRDDKGYWNQIEAYIGDHSEAEFTHGICPECLRKLYPNLDMDS